LNGIFQLPSHWLNLSIILIGWAVPESSSRDFLEGTEMRQKFLGI